MNCQTTSLKKKSKPAPAPELPKVGYLRLKETDDTTWSPLLPGPFLVPVMRWIE